MAQTLNEIQHFTNSIEEKIKHHFLEKNLEKPTIDQDKLFILTKLIPDHATLSNKDREVYIITTMLVQIALDTHELVTETSEDETYKDKLTNQLRVLAGDYYSGLYYYFLANINDIPFIHKLASAIKAINELKMQVYYSEYENITEYINLKVEIDYLLLESVARYFNSEAFATCFKQWIYISVLLREKDHILKDESFLNYSLDSQPAGSDITIENKFEALVHQEWTNLQNKIDELPHSNFEFNHYFNRTFTNNHNLNITSMEEG